jgi:hypothetical protein
VRRAQQHIVVRAYSFIFDIKYFALATLLDVWTAFIMRFLTCADSDADTAVGCDGEEGEDDDEEPKGLRPPKDILGVLEFRAGMGMDPNGYSCRTSLVLADLESLGRPPKMKERQMQNIPKSVQCLDFA